MYSTITVNLSKSVQGGDLPSPFRLIYAISNLQKLGSFSQSENEGMGSFSK